MDDPEATPHSFSSELDDGRAVRVRPVVPSDRSLLLAGLAEVSEETMRHRFLSPMHTLSDAQLRYFTEVDQAAHVAWGATEDQNGHEVGLGIGRYVRLREQPEAAEASLTVVDRLQGGGLGTLLMATLIVIGRRAGLRYIVAYVGTDNPRAADWFRRLGARAGPHAEFEGADVLFVDLDHPPEVVTPARARLDARIAEVEAKLFASGF